MTPAIVVLLVLAVYFVALTATQAVALARTRQLHRELIVRRERLDALNAQGEQIRAKYMQDRAAYRCMHCARCRKEPRS